MQLLGNRFCTFHDVLYGQQVIIKAEDFVVPHREQVRCFREYLGSLLAQRIGLPVPQTTLMQHERYGRISCQRFYPHARTISLAEMRAISATETGIRILLLDILCGNQDRRHENLIVRGTQLVPIDFNVAFAFKKKLSSTDINSWVGNWFGFETILALQPADWTKFSEELDFVLGRLDEQYLQKAVNYIDPHFLLFNERAWLLQHLLDRRNLLRGCIEEWWCSNVNALSWIHKQEIYFQYTDYTEN